MTVAGGLRYETGREMPPGMQEIYGVKLAGQMRADASIGPCEEERIATPAPPARNDKEGGADMPDEELLKELQERAMGLSFDTRYLIDELIKRYRIRCFEVAELRGRIADLERKAIPQSPAATAPFAQGSLKE